MIHSPGVLDLYDEIDRIVALKGKRWVIAHINTIPPPDIERIARMGLVLTTHTNNSLYKTLDTLAGQNLPERHREIVPLRSLLEAGMKMALATDDAGVVVAADLASHGQAFGPVGVGRRKRR